ncbi:MAG: efflux RND transporter permease subunit, partial [Candidatus Wallbacteria bacterium]|nr:efflux RND transporter permease subunit [Candidatus Wallbacteria bacterium]
MKAGHGLMEGLVRAFVDSRLTPLLVLSTVLLGLFAIVATPREEEPQITVPMMDVFVNLPGASAAEVEQRVSIPMEKKLLEIPGVEYVYGTAMPGTAMAIVRFYVGEDEERSIVKLYNKLQSNFDLIPPGASQPLVKPRCIDDVPILALTLWGEGYDHAALRRLAAELDDQLKQVPEVAQTTLIGGRRRQLRVELAHARMESFGVDPTSVAAAIRGANSGRASGSFSKQDSEVLVDSGGWIRDAEELGSLVIAVRGDRPVRLRDVAAIADGPEEPRDYVFFGSRAGRHPAVTISLAKRKGANAVDVSDRVLEKVRALRGRLLPSDVEVSVTRDYGATAREKSNELLKHLAIAIVSVSLLIALFLGGRPALVVLIAVPTTLALTLFIYYVYGYTINRVTLFALIFSIGILVDDPIVDVENVVRHFQMARNKGRPLLEVTVEAVNEVRSPLILATFAVIFAILPMAFVRGLMGPYMRPIPIGASTAMLFSMAIAFVVTPWAAYHLLGEETAGPHAKHEGVTDRLYRRLMGSLIHNRLHGNIFLASVVALMLAAAALVPFKAVQVKMLPFDNKSEFQVVLDMPEGTTLERTTAVAAELGDHLAGLPEVVDYQIHAGTSGPVNFNGLVRHYFLRAAPHQADLQVNLRPRDERREQSHEIARRVRPALQEIAARHGARLKVTEVPPGPPVLQTLVAEIYGPNLEAQLAYAGQVKEVFRGTPGVVDVDWYVEGPQPKLDLRIDQAQAAFAGISAKGLTDAAGIALGGLTAGLAHLAQEKEDVPIVLRLPVGERSGPDELGQLALIGDRGKPVRLSELVRVSQTSERPYLYRKNLRRVVYVTADVAGEIESP